MSDEAFDMWDFVKGKQRILQILEEAERTLRLLEDYKEREIERLKTQLVEAQADTVRLDWLCTEEGSKYAEGYLRYYGDLDRTSIDHDMEEREIPNRFLTLYDTADQTIFRWLDKRISELRFEQFLEVLRRAYDSWLSEGHLGESRALTFRGLVERAMRDQGIS